MNFLDQCSFEPLTPEVIQNCETFYCGDEDMDEFFRKDAFLHWVAREYLFTSGEKWEKTDTTTAADRKSENKIDVFRFTQHVNSTRNSNIIVCTNKKDVLYKQVIHFRLAYCILVGSKHTESEWPIWGREKTIGGIIQLSSPPFCDFANAYSNACISASISVICTSRFTGVTFLSSKKKVGMLCTL